MKKMILLSFLLLCAFAATSFATPPQEVKLSYDLAAKKLSVDVTHPSKDRGDHYIRKYVVTVNDGSPINYYRQKQESPLEFTEAFDVEAQPGDKIRVKLYCVDGGNAEEEIVVQKSADKADQAPSADASAEPAETMVETFVPPATMEPKGSGY